MRILFSSPSYPFTLSCFVFVSNYLFHDGGPYNIKASLLICSTNLLTGFYMIVTSVMEELEPEDWKD